MVRTGQVVFLLLLSDKEQHITPFFLVDYVTFSGGKSITGLVLGLPVEMGFVQGIIFVHGCGE